MNEVSFTYPFRVDGDLVAEIDGAAKVYGFGEITVVFDVLGAPHRRTQPDDIWQDAVLLYLRQNHDQALRDAEALAEAEKRDRDRETAAKLRREGV